MDLPRTAEARIATWLDQLVHGMQEQRAQGAMQLGQLAQLIPPGLIAAKVAADLCVWPAIVNALTHPKEDLGVKQAAVIALAQLISPTPPSQALRAWPHIRQVVFDLLWHVRHLWRCWLAGCWLAGCWLAGCWLA